MCTAAAFRNPSLYFGRTLDYEVSFGEAPVITPRNYPLPFRHREALKEHFAILGMARVEEGYPLYFDAINEKGLAMAGLNFVGNAFYCSAENAETGIAQFELIPWLLGQCATVTQVKEALQQLSVTDDAFSVSLPPAQLHWLVSDGCESLVIEPMKDGLKLYPNPVDILTNNPPFPMQLQRLNDFMQLSPHAPENSFSCALPLHLYSRGMGALGLPGDLSSQSRFVRGAFSLHNSLAEPSEEASVGQFFHILDTVSQIRGCCRLEENRCEITRFCSCCSAATGTYYYTTYGNRQISAVRMLPEQMDGRELIQHSLITDQQIYRQN